MCWGIPIFLTLARNRDGGCSLEPSRRGDSSVRLRSVFWATIFFYYYFILFSENFRVFFSSKKIDVYGQVFEMLTSSVIASQIYYLCALVNCFYLIRMKLLLLYC